MSESHDDDRPIEELTFDELIARSSFGTPEAVALRATCPPGVVDELMERLRADWAIEQARAGTVHEVSDPTEPERLLAMSTAGLPPDEVVRKMYCSCGGDKLLANDLMTQAVADELCNGDLHRVVTAVVYALQDYSAEIIRIPTDQWSAVIAETHDGRFQTRIECDYIEHGFAGTWLAFKERFPEGRYVIVDDEDDWAVPGGSEPSVGPGE